MFIYFQHRLDEGEVMPNPFWVSATAATVKTLSKKCPHCGKRASYPRKEQGQFYTCKYCGHRFKEYDSSGKK